MAHLNAVEWMKSYFDLCGDYQPNSDEIHLDPGHLIDIYNEYKTDLNGDHEVPLDYKAWRQAWVSVFPHVSIRQYKSVSGKVYLQIFAWLL